MSDAENQLPIVLIDGDVLCYNACENRFRNANGFTVVTLDEIAEDPEADALYLEQAYKRLLRLIQDALDVCFAEEYRIAVGGKGNFRKDIYPEYKMNRHADPKKRNPFVPKLRRLLAEAGLATEAHGMEADDQLRMWATELEAEGRSYVVVSIDKDLLMIPGRHYRIHKEEFVEMSKYAAMKFYYEQLLQGDPTDNIKGVPKVGPVKAQKYLEGCVTEQDHQAVVMQVYYTAFGKDSWRKELNLTGQLIYIKETADAWFSCDGWQEIEFEEIEIRPVKVKKGKKVEPWTIETAIAAINPAAVVTSERWDSAMMFLVESGDLPDELLSAVEALANRNKVPHTETDAYQEIVKHFSKTTAMVTPYISQQAFDKTFPDISMVPINLHVMGAAKGSELIAVGASQGTEASMFNFKLPEDLKIPEKITTVKPQQAPLRILSNSTEGIHLSPSVGFLNKVETPVKSIAPPVVPIPTFSASWGKKT